MQTIIGLKSMLIEKQNIKVQTFWISVFILLTAIGGWLEIPTKPIPFTLQTFFVILAGAILGARNGFISQFLYILLGAVGLPLFAGFSFGFAKLIGPTGGYLLSFPVAAFLVGYLINLKKSYLWILLSMSFGTVIIFIFGTLFLNFIYFNDWSKTIISGFLIFTWWDILKIFAAASIYHRLKK